MSKYTADELADDSEDERRLEKAERSAEKKAAKRKKKRADPPAGKQNSRLLPVAATGVAGPSGYQVPPRQPAAPLFRMPGPCFACGEMGHIRSRCPKTGSSAVLDARKWYPFPCVTKPNSGNSVQGESSERESINEEIDTIEILDWIYYLPKTTHQSISPTIQSNSQ